MWEVQLKKTYAKVTHDETSSAGWTVTVDRRTVVILKNIYFDTRVQNRTVVVNVKSVFVQQVI